MAQNNAKIYWVDDKITFIHGSVLDYINKLDYNVAYFDPPWSTDWVYYFDKWKFKFSDYGINGMDLINMAKQKTTNIIFALPKNFDFSELNKLETDYIVMKEFVNNNIFLYTLFLETDNNFREYKESIVWLREINKTILDTYINISKDSPDYDIRKIVYSNTLSYLKNALLRTPEDKHNLVFRGYNGDMERIIYFCHECMKNGSFELSEVFIKQLHKTLYPEWYIQKSKDSMWREFIWMIPGEYRDIDMISNDNANKDIYLKPREVSGGMQKAIREYNESSDDAQTKTLHFLVDFFIIHPFWDGNGRLAYILTDLLLLQNNLSPFYFWEKKENDKVWFYRILDEVYETRDIAPFYNFLEKYTV